MKTNLLNLKKIGFALVTFIVASTTVNAASFTAVATGNWSSTATWGGTAPSFDNTLDQITIPSGMTVTLDNNLTLNGALTALTVNGTLTSSTSTSLTVTYGTISGNGIINVGNIILQAGAAVTFTGTFTAQTLSNAALNLQTTATYVVNESLTLKSGVFNIQSGGTLTMGSNSTIIVDGGQISTNGGSLGLSNSYNVHYKAGNKTAGIELNGSGLNNLTVETGTGNTLILITGLTVNGTLDLKSGTLVLGANSLTLKGNIASGGSGFVATTATSNITISSATGTSGGLNFDGSSNTINNLTVNVGNANNTTLGGSVTVNGTMTLTSGTLNLNNSSNLTIEGGIASTGNGSISSTSGANITVNTTGSPSGSLTFASGGRTVNNLTVNLIGGGTLILNSDLLVNGTLDLNSGRLDLNGNRLQLGSSATVTGSNNANYIITGSNGRVAMSVTALMLGGVKYPVGTASAYLPLNITLGLGSTGGVVEVGVINNVYANGTTGFDMATTKRVVRGTWMVTSDIVSNMNMTIKAMWPTSAEVNGFTRTSAYISHYTGGNWDKVATAAATAEANGMFSLTRSGITSLSPFAVFDQTTTDVPKVSKEVAFSIYPNPSADVITVNNISSANVVTMDIVTINGQVVSSQKLTGNKNTVSVIELKEGYYYIKLYNNEINSIHKFVKN